MKLGIVGLPILIELLVEAGRIELPSENLLIQLSPGAVHLFGSRICFRCTGKQNR